MGWRDAPAVEEEYLRGAVDTTSFPSWKVDPSLQAVRDQNAALLRGNEAKYTPGVSAPRWASAPEVSANPAPTIAAPAPTVAAPAPQPRLEKSTGRKIADFAAEMVNGPLDVAATTLSGLPAQALGGLAGLVRLATAGGNFDDRVARGAQTSQDVAESLTWKPISKGGAAVGNAAQALNEWVGEGGESVGGNLGRSIGENAIPVASTVLPMPKVLRAARAYSERMNALPTLADQEARQFARNNAGKIEALDAADRIGVVTPPASTNPSYVNKLQRRVAGEEGINLALEKANEGVWEKALKKDIGIAENAPLDMDTLKAVRQVAARPNEEIGKLGVFAPDADTVKTIEGFRDTSSIVDPASADRVNTLVNRIKNGIAEGRPANQLLNDIRQLRDNAKGYFKSADPADVMQAKANIGIANALEGMIEKNLEKLGKGDLLQQFRDGRTRMAKSYTLEAATDFNTGKVNPLAIAKMTREDNALTGAFLDVGKVAGNFPEIAGGTVETVPSMVKKHLYRSSPGAMVGGALGAVVGPGGVLPGAMMGGVLTDALAASIARRSGSAAAQGRRMTTVPEQYWRPYANMSPQERIVDALRNKNAP